MEQALALDEAARRSRRRGDEDMTVIESGDEPDVAREQHAVAEHVARHVADTSDGKVGLLGVDAHLPEMALDRFPRAAGCDATRLVIVPERAARSERIALPR